MKRERRKDRRPDEPTFRFDRILFGMRITRRSGTRDWRQFEEDNAILTALAQQGQEETVKLFARGEIDMPQLRHAHARGNLASGTIVTSMALREPLWGEDGAFKRMLKKMGSSEASRARYAVSMKSLERKAAKWLGPKATVNELKIVDWAELQSEWGKSGSDWNRLRAMLSTFCTKLLKNKWDKFRIELLNEIPRAEEVERVCEISVDQFWKILELIDEPLRPMYVTLVATGMRWGEYARTKPAHLNAELKTVTVVGEPTRKNVKKKSRTIHVAEWLWPWVVNGVPVPLGYKASRLHWVKACADYGVPVVRIHDLRHLKGQVAIEGADITEVADVLGHTQLATTRRYVRRQNQERVAKVVGKGLKPSGKVLPLPTERRAG